MSAKLIQVIDATEHRGDGERKDPHRLVRQFWSVDGELVMERDEWKESQSQDIQLNAYCAAKMLEAELKRENNGRLAFIVKASEVIVWILEGSDPTPLLKSLRAFDAVGQRNE